MSALRWAATGRLVVQVVSWAGTLFVVRLLTPVDYGLMAKVSVVCTIAGTIAELGLGASVARSARLGVTELQSLTGFTLLFGAGVSLLLALCSPIFAMLLKEPRLVWPIAAGSLQVAIGALGVVPRALATRELEFKFLARTEMVAGLASVCVTVLLAAMGAGVWALVAGLLIGTLFRAAAVFLHIERIQPRLRWRDIDEHLKFGLTLVGNRVSYFVIVQSDILLGSLFLSTTEIGQYAVALQLATLPMSKVMGIINDVTLPTVAQQQHDRPRVKASLLKAIGLVAFTAMPVLFGISAVAGELVHVILDSKWNGVIPALAILPLIVPLRMICSVLFTTSLAMGNRQLDLRNTLANFAIVPTGFFIGAHWGIIGLSLSWLIAVPLSYVVSLPAALRYLGVTWHELMSQCLPPLVAAGCMYGVIYVLREGIAAQINPILALLVLTAAGVVVYFLAALAIARPQLKVASGFARSLMKRGQAAA